MPGKARKVVFRNFIAEVVKKQKRIIVRGIAEAESAPQMHAGSLQRWLGLNYLLHRANGHGGPPKEDGNANAKKIHLFAGLAVLRCLRASGVDLVFPQVNSISTISFSGNLA
jgi:hypothetical protein